jgi:hypothetical protein
MNDVYIIKNQEQYDAILTRLSVIEDRIKKAGIKEINFNEIWRLCGAVKDWEVRKYQRSEPKELSGKEKKRYGFFDD